MTLKIYLDGVQVGGDHTINLTTGGASQTVSVAAGSATVECDFFESLSGAHGTGWAVRYDLTVSISAGYKTGPGGITETGTVTQVGGTGDAVAFEGVAGTYVYTYGGGRIGPTTVVYGQGVAEGSNVWCETTSQSLWNIVGDVGRTAIVEIYFETAHVYTGLLIRNGAGTGLLRGDTTPLPLVDA